MENLSEINKTKKIANKIVKKHPKSKTLRVGVHMAGGGASDYAIKLLKLKGFNIKVVYAIEWDPKVREVFLQNFDLPIENYYEDITKVDEKKLPPIDVIITSPPCQPFSNAGYGLGFEDMRGTLSFDSVRIINHQRPMFVIYENVKGLTTHDKGNTFNVITESFESIGYDNNWKVLNALDYGLPQNRERIFGLLTRKDLNVKLSFEKKHTYKKVVLSDILEDIKSTKDVSKLDGKTIIDNKYIDINSKYNPNSRGILSRTQTLVYTNSTYDTTRRVQDSDGFCGTITRTPSKVHDIKNNIVRYLTIKERYLTLGFGDDYIVGKTKGINIHITGNTISVPVISELIEEVYEKFNQIIDSASSELTSQHISIHKRVINTPDLNYLNITQKVGDRYTQHLLNGGTITMSVDMFNSVEDKELNKISKKIIRNITSIKQLGFRDKKNGIYRYKLTSIIIEVDKVSKNHVLFTRPGGKGGFEKEFDSIHLKSGINNKSVDTVTDMFFGGGGYTLKNIEKLNFKHYIINDLDRNIITTMRAVKNNSTKVIDIYSKINNDYLKCIPDELKDYDPSSDDDKKRKRKKLRKIHREPIEYYQRIIKKLNNYRKYDIYHIAAFYIFIVKKTMNGLLEYLPNGDLKDTSFTQSYEVRDKSKMIKHWSYILNKYNVEIRNEDVFDLLQDKSIPKNSLHYLDPPYVDAKFAYNSDNSDDFQIRLLKETQRFDHIIYSNEDCENLHTLGINNYIQNSISFKRKGTMSGMEYLGYRVNDTSFNKSQLGGVA